MPDPRKRRRKPRRANHRAEHGSLTELNITPLLDLVFVLLVIFIITTPQLTNSLEINLPSGKPPLQNPNQPKPKINRIAVTNSGRPLLNGEPLTLEGLGQRLRVLKTADPDLGVVVEGADDADYQKVVDVLDLLQSLEITKLGLATEAARSP
jgi:biopolymer transport protein ExbD